MAVGHDALAVSNLSVVFRSSGDKEKSVPALSDFDLSVRRGELVCVVGPSGCGKSTFLNAVAGLLQVGSSSPVEITGDMTMNGAPLRGINPRIAYMFQKDTLLPWLSIEQNVHLPMKYRGLDAAARSSAAKELLAKVGLGGFENAFPKELSGGMRKRVQLAQLLAQDADLLFMDEPFGALDAQTKVFMQLEFLRIWEQERKTVIFVTHDLAEAVLLADRIVCMTARPGRVKTEMRVDIPRPRSVEDLPSHPDYPGLMRALWVAIEEESSFAMPDAQPQGS